MFTIPQLLTHCVCIVEFYIHNLNTYNLTEDEKFRVSQEHFIKISPKGKEAWAIRGYDAETSFNLTLL
jgi:hypothetical protein